MDWGQFCIMFRALYLEGMGRPHAGIRLILKNLVRKFRALGGELKLRAGVSRIKIEDDRAVGVVLDNGQELDGRHILSSAGAVETLRLCDRPGEPRGRPRRAALVRRIAVGPRRAAASRSATTGRSSFSTTRDKFHWQQAGRASCATCGPA